MISELDVLRIVSERLDAAQVPYMLTGSYAMAFYTTPRMTRDLDIVISLDRDQGRSDPIQARLGQGFWLGAATARCTFIDG
jgi:hypothetical protein